ncbi:unnamed protein product [Linum trigynum]|uniref:Uncharacterized protein n=1 Tax=Linum trigynum TaxID=586398 RepID=A0AAV2FIX5_9ROSI
MRVFSFDSDDRYIVPATVREGKSADVFVMNYAGESYDPEKFVARVGPSRKAGFNALQVWGVTIEGEEQFKELVADMAIKSSQTRSRSYRLGVNRFGLCFLIGGPVHPLGRSVVINDYFGWSKYGVEPPLPPPPDGTTTYRIGARVVMNSFEAFHNRVEVAVDVRGIMRAAEEAKNLRRRLERMEKEAEEVRLELTACRKEIECMDDAVERSEKTKVVLEKSAEEKEKEVEGLNSQLFAFKAALVSLVDHHHNHDEV